MAGRKTKLTRAKINEAANLVKSGNYAVIVCQYLGIHESTYYDWINRGKDDEQSGERTLYSEFSKAIKSAEAEAEVRNVAIIQKAAKDTWQAAAWYLERKHKSRWSAMHQMEHSGKDGGAIKVEYDLDKLSVKELEQIESILEGSADEGTGKK